MKRFNNVMKSNQGFTLIELVVVIVILGILAVTAAPKFIDLTSDAKGSVIQGVEGALNSAADMAHAKALVSNQTGAMGSITVAGTTVALVNGYPDKDSIDLLMDVNTTASGDITFAAPTGTQSTYSYNGVTDATKCQAVYNETTDANVKPVITSDTTGC